MPVFHGVPLESAHVCLAVGRAALNARLLELLTAGRCEGEAPLSGEAVERVATGCW
jgi:hypothetical protein